MNEQQASVFASAFSRVYGRVTNVGEVEITTSLVGSDARTQQVRLAPGESIMYGISPSGICRLFGIGASIITAPGADKTTICVFDWTDKYEVQR